MRVGQLHGTAIRSCLVPRLLHLPGFSYPALVCALQLACLGAELKGVTIKIKLRSWQEKAPRLDRFKIGRVLFIFAAISIELGRDHEHGL
jgi:hypothetical protein